MKRSLLSYAVLSLSLIGLTVGCAEQKTDKTHEQQAVNSNIADRLERQNNKKRAKNVILFVGDGMGVSTVTAGRILEGQLRGESGEENFLSFEKFPHTSLVKTYNTDAQVPDSAGTASALNTGLKTRMGMLGVGPAQTRGICEGADAHHLTNIAEYAEMAGMATGVVSTATLTHATPGAVYSHTADREWEGVSKLSEEAIEHGCKDIAQQLIEFSYGDGIDVALGGGKKFFFPAAEEGSENKGGSRTDGRNLAQEWQDSADDAAYVDNRTNLMAIDPAKTNRLLGLFTDSHMTFDAYRTENEPSLSDMTEVAINMLSKNENGFFLMVEAARIDHAHHAGNAYRSLHDVVALSAAVRKATEMVDMEDTLIIVTADHSHVMTMAGYPKRGNPILGLVSAPWQKDGELLLATDDKPYTTIGYMNGRGSVKGERPTLTQEQALDPDHIQQALVPTSSETHGGEDVPLYAQGPWAHLVGGVMEQNLVFDIIEHALALKQRAVAEASKKEKAQEN